MTRPSHMRVLLAVASLGASAVCFSAARAATTTTTFGVTATVTATCSVTASALAFGTYSGAQLDGSTTLTATCSTGTTYDVGFNPGTFTAATVATRRMTGADPLGLSYALFRDAARTLNWGSTIGTDTLHGTGNGAAQTLTAFGRIAGAQFPTVGAYADTITVTLTF